MAFNINAHVILQGPKNIKAVTNSIKQQLQGISVPVNLQTGQVASTNQQVTTLTKGMKGLQNSATATSKSLKTVNAATMASATAMNKSGGAAGKMGKNLKSVASNANQAGGAMRMLGRETALTFKRFAAAGIVTATVFRLGSAISEATGKALEFEREMVKLQQVTGKTAGQLNKLKTAVTTVSKDLGISANELAEISRLFAQTGQSLKEVESSMKAVARSSLAPTFGEMTQTAEGLIAAMNQFGIGANKAEAILGSLNRVSKKFAVESQDLIAAIRRAGGVFAMAAGQFKDPIDALNEFNAIFTAVRSTTRESAETIATGLRTIFTRIQRRGTIEMLRGLGIELTDTQGKFVGLFESFRILSRQLDKIVQKGDAITLSAITEELGGMRQIGKLLPAIREFRKAEAAFKEAQQGAVEGLGKDVEKGLEPLIKQFEKVGARFEDFIRTISESRTFKQLAQFAIDTANAFITLGEALTPILPLLTQFAAMRLARGAFSFGQGFFGSTKGLGAQGLGQRVGGVVAGKPTGAAPTQHISNNTTALLKNTTALSTLTTSLKPLSTVATELKRLHTIIGRLESEIRTLGTAVRARATASPYYGSSSGSRRGRRPFGGGGRVGFRAPVVPRVPKPTAKRGAEPITTSAAKKKTGLTGEVAIMPGISQHARPATTFGVVSLRPENETEAFHAHVNYSQMGGTIDTPAGKVSQRNNKFQALTKSKKSGTTGVTIQVLGDSLDSATAEQFEANLSEAMRKAVEIESNEIRNNLGIKSGATPDPRKAGINFENISGNLFELMLNTVGAPYTPDKIQANDAFDFPKGLGLNLSDVFTKWPQLVKTKTDAKRTLNKDAMLSLMKKGRNTLDALNQRLNVSASKTTRRAGLGWTRNERGFGAAEGLAKRQIKDEQYWTDDGLLKAILMPGELVSFGADPSTARQIAAGNVNAVANLNPMKTGVVPGTGNRDTYPMDLPPGAVVVPKGLSEEAMGEGYEPRRPLAYGGRVGRGRVGLFGGSQIPASQRGSGGGGGGGVGPATANFGMLADAAVGVAFSLQMLDFSNLTNALTSIGQLALVIPSAIAAFAEVPLVLQAAQAKIASGPLIGGAGIAGAAIASGFIAETLAKSLAAKFSGPEEQGAVEGVSRLSEEGIKTANAIRLVGSVVGGLTTALILMKLGVGGFGASIAGIGTAVVLAMRAFDDYNINLKKAAEFVQFDKFSKGIDKAIDTLELFNKQAFVSAEGITNITEATNSALQFNRQLASAASERALAEASASTGTGAIIGSILGGLIGFAVGGGPVGAAVGATAGAGLGEAAERYIVQGDAGDRAEAALKAADRMLEAVSDKLIESVTQAFEKIADDFVKSLDDGSAVFNKIGAIEAPLSGVGSTALEIGASFKLLQEVLKNTGEQGKAFADFMNTKVRAGMVESIKASGDNVKRLYSIAAAKGIDFTDVNKLKDNLAMLADAAGMTGEEAVLAAQSLVAFQAEQERNAINALKQKAAQEQLNRMLESVTKSLNLFVTGLEIMASVMETAAGRFSTFSSEVGDFASYLMGGGGRIMQPGRAAINPFTNIEASSAEAIEAGIERVGKLTGADTGGLSETMKLRKAIPELAKSLGDAAGTTKIQTGEQLKGILGDVLKDKFDIDISLLPPAVLASLERGLNAQVKGREGMSVNQLVRDEGMGALLDQFGEAAEQVRVALENSYKAVIQAQKDMIDVINQYIGVEKYRIDQSLKANAIIESTNSSLDRFRSETDYFRTANERVINRLNAIDRGQGNVTLNPAAQAAAVAQARESAASDRAAIAKLTGTAFGPEASVEEIRAVLENSGTIFDEAVLRLVDSLASNEKALIRETKKLEELIAETERLEAVNATLTDVQKAQMDSEAQARFFINQLARIEGEPDPIRRGQMLSELMRPFTAFSKALNGGTLSMRDFAALVENFDSRIRPILRSQGLSEAEINQVRRGFFAKFSNEFPGIFSSAVSQSFVSVRGPLEAALAAIASSMEIAGKKLEDIALPDLPGILGPAFEAMGIAASGTVEDIMNAASALAIAKAEALLDDTEDIASRIDEVIEQNLGFLSQGGVGEAIDATGTAAEKAAAALNAFGTGLGASLGQLNTELGNLFETFGEAGTIFNNMKDDAKEVAESAVDAGGTLVEDQQIRKKMTPYETQAQLINALEMAVATEDQAGIDALYRLARELGVRVDKEIVTRRGTEEGGMRFGEETEKVPRSPREVLDDIIGAGWFDVEESDIMGAASRAGVGRVTTTTTTSLQEVSTDKKKFDDALKLYTTGMQKSMEKLSRDKLFDIAKRESKSLVSYGLMSEATNLAGMGQQDLADLLTELATMRMEKRGDPEELYRGLVEMGNRRDAQEILNLDNPAMLETAQNTANAVGFLETIAENTGGTGGSAGTAPEGAKGGFLRGPSHARGGMMAELEGGEYVVNKRAVRKIGRGNLDAINAGRLGYGQAGGSIVLNSMDDLVNAAGSMNLAQLAAFMKRMEEFSGGNGIREIMQSPKFKEAVKESIKETVGTGMMSPLETLLQGMGVDMKNVVKLNDPMNELVKAQKESAEKLAAELKEIKAANDAVAEKLASCECTDKIIAFLAGFPVDIAKSVISANRVGGGAGAGRGGAGGGGGTKPLDPDGVMEITPGGPRHPGPGEPPYIPGGSAGPQGTSTLGAIGDAIGGAISGTVGNIVDGIMGSASMISDIKSGLEGALESVTSGIGDFFSGGGAQGFQNIEPGKVRKMRPPAQVDPTKVANVPHTSATIESISKLANYFSGSLEQFADGLLEGAKDAVRVIRQVSGNLMTDEEWEKYVDSLLPPDVLNQKRVNEARKSATRGADYEVTDFDKKVRNLTPEQAAMFSDQERKTGSGQGQFTEKARKDRLAKLESQAAKFRRGGKFGRPSETSTTYYSGFKNRFDDPDTHYREVDPNEQARRDKLDADMEREYNRRKNAGKFGSVMEIVPGGGPRSMGPGGKSTAGATAQRFKNQAAAAREKFKNRNRGGAAAPPAAAQGPTLTSGPAGPKTEIEKQTVQLVGGICACIASAFASLFKPVILTLEDVEEAIIEKPVPEIPPAEPPKIPVDPVPTPDPKEDPNEIGRIPPIVIDPTPSDKGSLPDPSEIKRGVPTPSDPPSRIAPLPRSPGGRYRKGRGGFDPTDPLQGIDPSADLLPDGRGAAPKPKSRLGPGGDFVDPTKIRPLSSGPLDPSIGGFQSIIDGGIRKILDLNELAAGGIEGLGKLEDIIPPGGGLKRYIPEPGDGKLPGKKPGDGKLPGKKPGGKFDREDPRVPDYGPGSEGLEPFPPLDKGPGGPTFISEIPIDEGELPDTIEEGNKELVKAIGGICGCFAISVGETIEPEIRDIEGNILESIGNALLNAAKTVGSDLIEKGKSFVDFITDKDAIKSTLEKNRAELSAVGDVDVAKSGIDNIFGFIDGIKAIVNNIQKGQPYEGLGGRPYVATPMRDQEGNMTGFSPVPQRSAAGPGRGPLFLGVGRAGQERYDTMKKNRDKFAAQLEDPEFLELAKKNPKGYAARILAQKEALDANLQELEEVYGFGAGAAGQANEAKDKAEAAGEKIEPGTETVRKDPALASALAKNMGFDWNPSDEMGIKDLIVFLKNTCLSVQFCDKGTDRPTPEEPKRPFDEGPVEGPGGQTFVPDDGTDGTIYKPAPPAYAPDPYPSDMSPDDDYEDGDFDWGGEGVSPPSMRVQDLFPPGGNLDREVAPPKFLGGQSAIGTPFGGNAGGKAPGDETSVNTGNIISRLEGIGPLISDETVNKLTAFGNIFSQGVAAFDGYIGRLESVAQSLPTEIVMTLQTPRVEVIVNMNNATNRITQVVESVIQGEIGDKFKEMSQRITSLENKNNPLGNDSSATYPNNP